jgi:hypothetical protein
MTEELIPPVETGENLPSFGEANEVKGATMAKKKSKAKAKKKTEATVPSAKPRAKPGQGHTRFVGILIHLNEELLRQIDRRVAEAKKKLPDERHSRSSWARGLIAKALQR